MSEEEHREKELEEELDDLYRKSEALDDPGDSRNLEEVEDGMEPLSDSDFPESFDELERQAGEEPVRGKLQGILALPGTIRSSFMRALAARRAARSASATKFNLRVSRRTAVLAVVPLFLGVIIVFAWLWLSHDDTGTRTGGVPRQESSRTAAEAMRAAEKAAPPAPGETETDAPQPAGGSTLAAAVPPAEEQEARQPSAAGAPSADSADRREQDVVPALPAAPRVTPKAAAANNAASTGAPTAAPESHQEKMPVIDLSPAAEHREEIIPPFSSPVVARRPAPKAAAASSPAAAAPAAAKEGNGKKPAAVHASSANRHGNYAIQIRAYPEKKKAAAKTFLTELRKREPDAAMETVQIEGRGVWHRILLGNFPTPGAAADYGKKHQLARKYPGSFIQRRSGNGP